MTGFFFLPQNVPNLCYILFYETSKTPGTSWTNSEKIDLVSNLSNLKFAILWHFGQSPIWSLTRRAIGEKDEENTMYNAQFIWASSFNALCWSLKITEFISRVLKDRFCGSLLRPNCLKLFSLKDVYVSFVFVFTCVFIFSQMIF